MVLPEVKVTRVHKCYWKVGDVFRHHKTGQLLQVTWVDHNDGAFMVKILSEPDPKKSLWHRLSNKIATWLLKGTPHDTRK